MKKVLKTYFTSNYWKKLFNENRKLFRNNLKTIKKAFVAFNANIDYIAELDKNFPLKFDDIPSNAGLPNSINSITDLKKALVYSFTAGKAVELKIVNEELYHKLLALFDFKEKRIGGQMGIVANTLNYLGVEKVIIYTQLLSEKQAKMFNKGILFPELKNNRIVLEDARTAGDKNKPTRINIIIEYDKGFKIKLKDKNIIIPRNNRFIISAAVHKSKPLLPKELLKKGLFSGVNRLFLSGYHHIEEKNAKKTFNEWIKQIEIIKSLNNELIIHLEYVDLHQSWLNRKLFKVLKHVHSFGLNEVELMNIMSYLGESELAESINESDFESESLIRAGEYLMKKFNLMRISIHTLDFIICIARKNYPAKLKKLLHANIYGLRVVNSKGLKGENFRNELKNINNHDFNGNGLMNARIDETRDFNIIVAPNFSEESVEVRYTVGLGDTLSSAILYAELI